jgi:hypothetical protein
MPRYIEIDAKRLEALHAGLDLLEAVDRSEGGEALRHLDLHIYGISNDPQVLDAAREAIADSNELQEEDVQVGEVAVSIPISADTIYALLGSGIRLKGEDFAYMGSGGEGIRSMSFAFANFKPTVTLGDFSKLAIASSDSWIDDFLKQYGTGQAAKITPAVHRTQEATQPQAPALQTPPPAVQGQPAAAPAAPGVPKQTSKLDGRRLSAFLDDFLD